MNRNSILAVGGLFAAPLLLAALPARDKIQFAPAEGSTVSFSYEMTSDMALDDMAISMNGQEMPMEMDMELTSTNNVSFTDTFSKVSEGTPARFERTFDGIATGTNTAVAMDVMGQNQDETIDGSGTSPLEGKTVVFTAKDGAFEATWPEGEDGDAELLEGLEAQAWLQDWVPTEDVAEGATWDIEPTTLKHLFAPGGNLHLEMSMGESAAMGMGPDSEMFSNLGMMLDGVLEGAITAKFTGYREVDGAKLAVVEIEVEIDSAADMLEFMRESMEENIPPDMPIEMDIDHVDMTFVLEATGEMLWDAKAGRLASLSLEGEMAVGMEMAMAMDAGGQQMEMENSMEMSGTFTQKVTAD